MSGDLTCWSCSNVLRAGTHVMGVPRLWCLIRKRDVNDKCWEFDYEPGSDEKERESAATTAGRSESMKTVPSGPRA